MQSTSWLFFSFNSLDLMVSFQIYNYGIFLWQKILFFMITLDPLVSLSVDQQLRWSQYWSKGGYSIFIFSSVIFLMSESKQAIN